MKRLALAALVFMSACGTGPGRQTTRELDRIGNDYARQEYRERQQGATAAPAAPAANEDRCGAAAFADRVGAAVADLAIPDSARVIRPDSIVTRDFRPNRLNFIVDAAGTITAVQCY